MITKDTIISIKFCADRFLVEPQKGVLYQLFDEKSEPLLSNYDMESLMSLDDERISALNIGLSCIKALFESVTKMKNERNKTLASEISQITQAPVSYHPIQDAIGPTGMSDNLKGHPRLPDECE